MSGKVNLVGWKRTLEIFMRSFRRGSRYVEERENEANEGARCPFVEGRREKEAGRGKRNLLPDLPVEMEKRFLKG